MGRQTDELTDGRTDGGTNGLMDECKDDGRADGWMTVTANSSQRDETRSGEVFSKLKIKECMRAESVYRRRSEQAAVAAAAAALPQRVRLGNRAMSRQALTLCHHKYFRVELIATLLPKHSALIPTV